ncbi:hypothetical protein CLV34_2669 [Luteimicrobium subarcticum]|uniref:Uncharacterized protein n=1 Tax=Luteimicrobium subarcticum TaxID=620910 RepID=A0A2M8W736_9MICO|nr:hypothetical protein CLV34_2669 [Luteimicrobium subarcticum]
MLALLVTTLLALLAGTAGPAAAGPAAAEGDASRGPFVLVGTGGLRAEDVSPTATPEIWRALGGWRALAAARTSSGSAGGTGGAGETLAVAPGLDVVRSVGASTCPADGWLAVSTGRRAADDRTQPDCRTLVEPGADGRVPAWDEYTAAVDGQDFDARPGALGDAARAAGTRVTSIGPGAAIAVSDADGAVVGTHVDLPTDPAALGTAVRAALGSSDLVVVDAGSVTVDGRTSAGAQDGTPGADAHAQQVAAVDARVGAVLRAVAAGPSPAATDVLVVSLADSGTTPHLQLALGTGPALSTDGDASDGTTVLASSSTRQPGLVQTTDVQVTVTDALGIPVAPEVTVGSAIGTAPSGTHGTARLHALVDVSEHASAARPLIAGFYVFLVLANLLLYVFVVLGLRVDARWLGGAGQWLRRHPDGVLRALVTAGVALGSLPVATTLANLVPWWRAGSPGWVLTAVVVGWVALITAVATAMPWRRPLLWPLGVVGGVTAGVLALDAVTGATLQLSGLMGTQPMVAGRFYGINNTSFALFATASVMLAVALANPLVLRGRRRAAAVVVAVVGVVATAIDGLPSVGADFGGPPGLVVGFALLTLLAAGVRLTWRRVLVVLVGAALVVVALAVSDYLRPPEQRTHLGRFVDDVLHGGQSAVLTRKLGQNFATLTNPLALVVTGGVLVLVLVLGRPLRGALVRPAGSPLEWLTRDTPLSQLGHDAPMLGPGIVATTTILGLGFLANDSGILVPATGILVALPVLLAVYADWLLGVRSRGAAAPRPPSDGSDAS